MNRVKAGTINVLVVDDDDVATEGVLRGLKKCPISLACVTAEDGMEALRILRGQHPHKRIERPLLVLLDLNMPNMDGLEFLAHIRADAALHATVVFVLTTSSTDADRARAYHQHIAGYMVKSEVGPQFAKLAQLLSSYGQSVSLQND